MKVEGTQQRHESPAGEADVVPALWQRRTPSPLSVGRVAGVSLRAGWHLLLAAGVGILAAVVLLGAVPLYSNIVSNVQLQASINHQGPIGCNVELVYSYTRISTSLVQAQDAAVRPIARQYLSSYTQPTANEYYVSDKTQVLSAAGRSLANVPGISQAVFAAYDYTQAAAHLHLVAGALPSTPTTTGATSPPDALIPVQMARNLGVGAGDTLVVTQLSNASRPLTVRISGVWDPGNGADPYWNGRPFFAFVPGISRDTYIYTLLLDRQTFLSSLYQSPLFGMEQHWLYYTEPLRITTANMAQVAASIGQVRTHLATNAVSPRNIGLTGGNSALQLITGLNTTIGAVQQQLALLALPLYAIAAQVVGLALVFVIAMATLLVDGHANVVATLKTRGASDAQILMGYGCQAVVLAGVDALVGLWLARAAALALARWLVPAQTFASAGLGQAHFADFAPAATAATPVAAGALLGACALVVAAGQANGSQALTLRQRQGRGGGSPWWHRLYLDLGLAVICLLAYIDLSRFGSLGLREQLGQQATGPLVLLTPDLLLLAGVLLLFRLFPLITGLGIRLTRRRRGASSMLALAHISRNPTSPARLALLLSLAVGVGLFALIFNGTLARSTADRAAYQAGADVRIVEAQPVAGVNAASIQTQLAGLPGVRGLTPVFRGLSATTSSDNPLTVAMLAIDPNTWASVAGQTSWRPDYASEPLSRLMGLMQAHQSPQSTPAQSTDASAGDAQHPLWALVSASFAASQRLEVGSQFTLALSETAQSATVFTTGAIVNDFPTLYPQQTPGGFIVMSLRDYDALRASPLHGPNEFWASTSPDVAQRDALSQALTARGPALQVNMVVDRRAQRSEIEQAPLQAGIRGLLLASALAAAALALIGCMIESALAARQRTVQMAVLRTPGMSKRQLTRLLIIEQVVVYAFGVVTGTILGGALAFASLPYLQFSDTAPNPTTLGVPPYVLSVSVAATGTFYLGIVVALLLALALAAFQAARIGIGRTLRLGDD